MEAPRGDDDERQKLLKEEGATEGLDPRIVARFSKVNILRKWITIEPCMFLYFTAFIPLIPLGEQYVVAQVKAQRNIPQFNQNDSVSPCDTNVSANVSKMEEEAQAEASHWLILFNACFLVPGLFVTVLIGSYSDRMGRKIGLLAPITGNLFRCAASALVIAFNLPFELLMIGLLIDGFSGGVASVITAGFSTISDVTTHKQRALRIMIVEISLGLGMFLGQLGAGFLIQKIGFAYTFGVCAIIQGVNLLYVIFVVIETRIADDEVKLFTLSHYARIWKLLTDKDQGTNRWELWSAFILLFLSMSVEAGSIDNLTYFEIARPLCFTSILIGYFQALNNLARYSLSLLTVKLLTGRVSDLTLVCVGFTSGVAFCLLVAFSTTAVMIFHVIMAGSWYTLVTPMIRSITSKAVSPSNQGVLFSAVAMIQSVAMFSGSAIFNAIYAATVQYFKGTVFLVQAGILLCGLVLALCFMVKKKRRKKSVGLLDVAENH